MKPELYMREERDSIDLFSALVNVSSMDASKQNFDKLRKPLDKAVRRILKEVKMKRMRGVSIGEHPFYGRRGSFDGEKMVVSLRLKFNQEGMERYDEMSKFVKGLGFEEKSMSLRTKEEVLSMDVVKELQRVAKSLTASEIPIYKGTQKVVHDGWDEKPGNYRLDDLVYSYEQSIGSLLGDNYFVEVDWKGKPKVKADGEDFVVTGEITVKVSAKVVGKLDIERAIKRSV